MRGDVRAVERSEGRLEGAAAGEGNSVLLVFGMAADAAAGLGEIFAPLGIVLSERVADRPAEQQAENNPCRKRALQGLSGLLHVNKHSAWAKKSPAGAGLLALQ